MDWGERRGLATAAPDCVYLALQRNGESTIAELRSKGGWRNASRVILYSSDGTKMKMCPGESIDQSQLCSLLLCPPVIVTGVRNRVVQWKIPLDYGELWPWLDRMLAFHQAKGSQASESIGTASDPNTDTFPRRITIRCEDVRHMRKSLFDSFADGPGGTVERMAMKWFVDHYRAQGALRFPKWITEMVEDLSMVRKGMP